MTSVRPDVVAIGREATKLVLAFLDGRPAPDEVIRIPKADRITRESTHRVRHSGARISEALAFIARHACDGITVANVVEQTQGVTRLAFEKQFEKGSGITPAFAIRKNQLATARDLLSATGYFVTKIAAICTYSSNTHFRKVFRAAEGMSPSESRRLNS